MALFGKKIPKWRLEDTVETAVRRVVDSYVGELRGELSGLSSMAALRKQITKLQEESETLRIEKGRREEEFARREREVEHKVGLERARQSFEVDEAKRLAVLSVREENLKADRTRFEEQMKFHQERFEKEVGYLKDMLVKITERLPSARFTADLTPKGKR